MGVRATEVLREREIFDNEFARMRASFGELLWMLQRIFLPHLWYPYMPDERQLGN